MKKICMNVFVCAVFLSLLLSGCSSGRIGGQVKGESYASGNNNPYPSAAPKKAKGRSVEGASGMADYAAEEPSPEAESPPDQAGASNQNQTDDEAVIIYEADCSIAVRSVKDAVLALERVGREFDARVENISTSESYRGASVTVRVPVKNFERFLKELPRIGRIESRTVSAVNITDEFRDLGLRLNSAEKVRTRLYELLKKEKNVSGRIAVLREIDRISSKIGSLNARLEYLKSLADFSVVRISLSAERQDLVKHYILSPFTWIQNLSADSRSLSRNADIIFILPRGYFSFEKDFLKNRGRYLCANPGDNAGFRAGIAENYPAADILFWERAVDFDAANRLYRPLAASKISAADGTQFILRSWKTAADSRYAVAYAVRGDEILVVEGFFADEKSYASDYAVFETFVQSLRWK